MSYERIKSVEEIKRAASAYYESHRAEISEQKKKRYRRLYGVDANFTAARRASLNRYYYNNKEACIASSRKYYAKNKDKARAAARAYYQRNKDACVAASKEYYANHKDKHRAAACAYYHRNKDKVKAAAEKRELKELFQDFNLTYPKGA